MSGDREQLVEQLDTDEIRERLDEKLDPAATRERLDDLYARFFLPPSVTDDESTEPGARTDVGVEADVEPFDFAAWLDEGRGSGPTKPPAETRVVTDAVAGTAGPVDADYTEFDFTGWLSAGDSFEPIEAYEPEPEDVPAGTETPVDVSAADEPLLPHPTFGVHPAKAATFALFLAVVALVALTVTGYLPALGPTGLGI